MKTFIFIFLVLFCPLALFAQTDWEYGVNLSAYKGIYSERATNFIFQSNRMFEVPVDLTTFTVNQTLASTIWKPSVLVGPFIQVRDAKFGIRLSSDFFSYQYAVSTIGTDLKKGIITPISNISNYRASVFQIPAGFIRYWKKWTFYYGSGFTIVHIKDLTSSNIKETFIEEHRAFSSSLIPNFKSIYGWFLELSLGREFPKLNGSIELGIRMSKDGKNLFKDKKLPTSFYGGRDLVYLSMKLPLKKGKIVK
ncbi:MAG: hypothetical protein RLZZ292_2966 [Bacteroidota bacterium]|jgi:hypothetical protein